MTWVLLVFGSTVRVFRAGLACPDWPLCYGQVVPDWDFKVYLEFGHRAYAGLISLLFFGVAWAASKTDVWPRVRGPFLFAATALFAQVILGGLTVLELLAEWTVASHLIVGNTFCASLLWMALRASPHKAPPAAGAVKWLAVALLIAVPCQMALGGLVSAKEAALVCPAWPTCDGTNWFPTWSGAVGVHLMHRTFGYAVGVLGLTTGALAWRRGAGLPALAVLGFITMQVSLGIANLLFLRPIPVTLAHSGTAALIVLSTTWLVHTLFYGPVSLRADARAPAPVRPVEAELSAEAT